VIIFVPLTTAIMRPLLFLLLITIPLFCSAQNYLGKNKAWVRKFLQKEIKKNDSLDISLIETDSSILYSIKPGKTLPGNFLYSFDRKGICIAEKVMAACDSCLVKYLQKVLAYSKFGWRKINENQYVSNYEFIYYERKLPPKTNMLFS